MLKESPEYLPSPTISRRELIRAGFALSLKLLVASSCKPDTPEITPDLEQIYESAEILKSSTYYQSNERFRELVDEISCRSNKISIKSDSPDGLSSVSRSFDGNIEIKIKPYIKIPDQKDVYYYLTPVGTAAFLAHEITHVLQTERLLIDLEKDELLSDSMKRDLYYQRLSQKIDLGVGELEAQWVQYKVFNELKENNKWRDNYFEPESFPEERNLTLHQESIQSQGLGWKSDSWLGAVAFAHNWNWETVERIKEEIDNYPSVFE